jgi:hypothetical protein
MRHLVFLLEGPSEKEALQAWLANGRNLVLEIKGEDSPMNRAKRDALALWVKAVNAKGGFGRWCSDVAFKPAELQDILSRHGHGNQPNDDAAKVPFTP